MLRVTCDADLAKARLVDRFEAFVCSSCQRRAGLPAKSNGTRSLDCATCQVCGHIGDGFLCICALGDWLSVKPIDHSSKMVSGG